VSFDPALPTDRDWVRLLIGDTDPLHEALTDATIDALIAKALVYGASAEGAKYCAAATAGLSALARWQNMGGAVVSKQVSKLSITYKSGGESDAYRGYLDGLKQQCTALSLSSPAILKAW
jgi:hypothetical protein